MSLYKKISLLLITMYEDYVDYVKYSLINSYNIHINDPSFFQKQHDAIAFDSEGQNPATLVQFCVNKDVYLFNIDEYEEQIKSLLEDFSVKKYVFGLHFKQKEFGKINNVIDLQKNQSKSFCAYINEIFSLNLKKNKSVHYKGWNSPFTDNQIIYSSAGAIWIYKISKSDLI